MTAILVDEDGIVMTFGQWIEEGDLLAAMPNLDDLPQDLSVKEIIDAHGDELFDFANLTVRQTGLPGIVFICTETGSRGPCVKYYEAIGLAHQGFSVSIESDPKIIANSMAVEKVVRSYLSVARWVMRNEQVLLEYWEKAAFLDINEVSELIGRLKQV